MRLVTVSLEPGEIATLQAASRAIQEKRGVVRDLDEILADVLTLALEELKKQLNGDT